MTTAFLICGSTGAGKTTYSRTLAESKCAQVFSIDEWMKTLFWMDAPPKPDIDWSLSRVHRCEIQIWLVSQRLLKTGQAVVLDLGFSKKEQRDRVKSWIESAGYKAELHFLDVPVDVRRKRVQARNLSRSGTFSFEVDDAMFDWMESYFERPSGDEIRGALVVH